MKCKRCFFLYIAVALLTLVWGALALAGSATLNWTDNSTNESGFNIERKPGTCASTGAFAEIATVPANSTTYKDVGVTEGLIYCWRVAASNSAGKSGYSNTAELTIPFTIPAAPSLLGATPGP